MSDTKCFFIGNQLSFPLKELESRISIKTKQSSVISNCRICLSSVFSPAALTCGHRFCENCLDQYWHSEEKPSFVTCPLCRAHAYNVDFTENVEVKPEGEFRKNFGSLEEIEDVELNKSTLWCFKISILIPILFFFVKWLNLPAIELALSRMRYKLWHYIN